MRDALVSIGFGLLGLALFALAIAGIVGAFLAVVFGPWWAKTAVLVPLVLWLAYLCGKDMLAPSCTCRHGLFTRYESQSCPKHGKQGK